MSALVSSSSPPIYLGSEYLDELPTRQMRRDYGIYLRPTSVKAIGKSAGVLECLSAIRIFVAADNSGSDRYQPCRAGWCCCLCLLVMGKVTVLCSFLLLLHSTRTTCTNCLRTVQATRLHSTQGQKPAIVTMPNDLIARLRCSPTLGKPSALDKDWFNLQIRPSPVPRADNRVSARPKPRRASLSLVLRETEEGKVEMLVIKRAANPRRDLGVFGACVFCFLVYVRTRCAMF